MADLIEIFLAGDVMTGRGIDQVLPTPSDPRLFEDYVRDATEYVHLAERANGPIDRPVSLSYIWGVALETLDRRAPDARIVNLETSVTRSDDYWRRKGINYRMHPDNIDCLTAAGIGCCVLANNHVLDWGFAGLRETLVALDGARLRRAGAGATRSDAAAPAIIDLEDEGRVLVVGLGSESSGIPPSWGAGPSEPGVNLLPDLTEATARRIAREASALKRSGDVLVASIHWGGNWGYGVPAEQAEFAHALIDSGAVDIVHGHSSHHAKGIEVYKDKPIIYGCGDFVNDYEGISGHEQFRGDLSLMYFVTIDAATGRLARFEIVAAVKRRFSLAPATRQDCEWTESMLNREGARLGTRAELGDENTLTLTW